MCSPCRSRTGRRRIAGAAERRGPGHGAPAGFDACTVGFGIRNVPDIVGAFSEMRRVCRPGGRVVCLEITQPTIPVFKQFYALWFRRGVPVLGRLAARDATAYTYLPASVLRFPGPDELKRSDGAGRSSQRRATRSWPGGSSPCTTRSSDGR